MVGSLPFGATTSILRRFLDDPRIPLKRADIIVQWEVARKRAATPPGTLLSTVWAPWWDFRLASHIRATSFRPVPRADGGHLVVTRRDPPLLPLDIAGAYGEFVRSWWALRR
jgi:23S rRNA (adenine-N6)-dimethyltransferase